jgi:hypothetical protein
MYRNYMGSTAALLSMVFLLVSGYAWTRGTGVGAAQPDQASEETTVGGDDLLIAGRSIHVERAIAGDVAAAGADIVIDGPVNGYVMGAGRNVTVDGQVENDVWAAGETVNVNTSVGNNALLAGRFVYLGPHAVVGHDARLAGNTVTAQGRVERNLRIGAETVRIGGEIGGAVNARAQHVSVLPGTIIHGDLVVRANEPPEISPQAQVLGQVRFEDVDRDRWLAWPGQWLFRFVALLTLGIAAVTFSPSWPTRVAETLRARPSASILTGFVALILIPLAIVAIAVTVVGIPLAIVLFAFYILTLLLSGVFVSFRLGDWLLARTRRLRSSVWARMALGVFVVSLAMSIPVVGIGFTAVVLIIGAGALLLERRSHRRSDRVAMAM